MCAYYGLRLYRSVQTFTPTSRGPRDVQRKKADCDQCEWATHGLLQAAEKVLDDLNVGRCLGRKKCTDRLEEVREPTDDDTPEALFGHFVAAGHSMRHRQTVQNRPGVREVHFTCPCFDETRSEAFSVLSFIKLVLQFVLISVGKRSDGVEDKLKRLALGEGDQRLNCWGRRAVKREHSHVEGRPLAGWQLGGKEASDISRGDCSKAIRNKLHQFVRRASVVLKLATHLENACELEDQLSSPSGAAARLCAELELIPAETHQPSRFSPVSSIRWVRQAKLEGPQRLHHLDDLWRRKPAHESSEQA